MPTRHRDFRRRRQPQSDFWGTVRFLLWLGFFGILSFAVGALVIARVALPGATKKPVRSPEPSSGAPAPTAPPTTSRAVPDEDTIVEPVLPGSAQRSSVRTSDETRTIVEPSSPAPRRREPRRETTQETPRRDTTQETPRRARREPERRATADTAEEPRRSTATASDRTSERRERTGTASSDRQPEIRRTTRETRAEEPPTRVREKPRTPPAERSERRNGGIQRGETID